MCVRYPTRTFTSSVSLTPERRLRLEIFPVCKKLTRGPGGAGEAMKVANSKLSFSPARFVAPENCSSPILYASRRSERNPYSMCERMSAARNLCKTSRSLPLERRCYCTYRSLGCGNHAKCEDWGESRTE